MKEMYQMTMNDVLFRDYMPNKRIHPSGEYLSYVCPMWGWVVGMQEKSSGKWLHKDSECRNGHKIRWKDI